jgi:hypothetical protein
MFRRSRKPASPLHRKQQEIAQKEAQLREQVESLERIVTQSRPPAQNKSPTQSPDRRSVENKFEKRFHVSIAMDSRHAFNTDGKRPRALRKERRQGQIIFLILLAALAVAVMWLISHVHP